MSWESGYDFLLSSLRLISASTDVQADGTEEFFLFGYGATPAHQHVYFRRSGDQIEWGGTHLKQGTILGLPQSLSTQGAPLVAQFQASFDSETSLYAVKLIETLEGSTVSTVEWTALESVKRMPRQLPGDVGESYVYDLRFLVGSGLSDALADPGGLGGGVVAPFAKASSAGLLVQAHRL
jgi:hypothetical protein